MRKPLRSLAMATLLLTSGCAGGQTGDGGGMRKHDAGQSTKPDAGQPFGTGSPPIASITDLIGRMAATNYQPARSLQELVDRSDVIATGTLVSRRPATIPAPIDGAAPEDTANITVVSMQVDRALLGDPRSDLEIGFYTGGAETKGAEALPKVRVLVFLTDWDVAITTEDDAGDAEPLYRLTTPQGMAIESSGHGIEEIFEPTDTVYAGHETFDELIQATEALTH